jgi:mono/diheme cytochrome c family protein
VNARRYLRWLVLAIVLAEPALAAGQAPSPPPRERGKALYLQHCAVCHGADGRAGTPVGRMLEPRPRDFGDPVEMARVTVDRIYRAIKEGRPGTAMAAWDQVLTEPEIGDVIDHIHSLASPGRPPLSPEKLSLEVGRRIYEKQCAFCHGADGRADTEVAKVLNPPPRNFSDPVEMARVDDGRMYSAIKLGREGTAMGGRGELLSPAEIIDVMRFVRTLVRPLPSGMTTERFDVLVGERIYRERCAVCHGEKGNALTPLGLNLVPAPRDFTDAKGMGSVTDKQLTDSIMRGRPGTAMAPWRGVLNRDDVRRVILYIRRTLGAASSASSGGRGVR